MEDQINWSNLPPHIIRNFCDDNAFRELKILKLVCHDWCQEINNLVDDKGVFSLKGITDLQLFSNFTKFSVDSMEHFRILLKYKPRITYLKVTADSFEDLKFMLANAGNHIKELHIIYHPKDEVENNDYTQLNYQHLKTVRHLNLKVNKDNLMCILESLHNLKKLEFHGESYDNEFHKYLTNVNPDLEELLLEGQHYHSFDFMKKFEKLKLLEYSGFPELPADYFNRFVHKNLEVLNMGRNSFMKSEHMDNVLRNSKHLQKIRLNFAILSVFPLTMPLKNLKSITTRCFIALRNILSGPLPNLTYLHLIQTNIHRDEIELMVTNAPNLRTLIMAEVDTSFIEIADIEYLSKGLKFLSRLEISQGVLLNEGNEKTVDFPELKTLSIYSPLDLDDQMLLHLKGDRVETLNLSLCQVIDGNTMKAFTEHFPNVKTLIVSHCPKITNDDASFICDKLQKLVHLECGSIESLAFTADIVKKVVEGKKLYYAKFQFLNFEKFESLSAVDLFFTNLGLRIGE